MLSFFEFYPLLLRRERVRTQVSANSGTFPDLPQLAYGFYRALLGYDAVSTGNGNPVDVVVNNFIKSDRLKSLMGDILSEVKGDERRALIASGDLAISCVMEGANVRIPAASNNGKDWQRLNIEVELATEYGLDPTTAQYALAQYKDRIGRLAKVFSAKNYYSSQMLELNKIPKKLQAIAHSVTLQEVAGLGDVIDVIDQWGNVEDLNKLLACLGKINSQFNLTRQVRSGFAPVTGMTYGNEIADLFPEEFALPDDLFDLGFVEESLMLSKSGKSPKSTGGDFICLIDYSASTDNPLMDINEQGKEVKTEFSVLTYERAVAMSIAFQLKKKKRRVYLAGYTRSMQQDIHYAHRFGTDPKKFISLMTMNSSGAEDYMKAIDYAVKVITGNGGFKDADILLITDGQSNVHTSWLKKFLVLKDKLSITVHTLIVGKPYEPDQNDFSSTLHYFSDSVTNVSAWKDTQSLEGIFEQLRHDTEG